MLKPARFTRTRTARRSFGVFLYLLLTVPAAVAVTAAEEPTVTAGGMPFQVVSECESPEYCCRLDLAPPVGKEGQYVVKLLLGYHDEENYYSLALGRNAALLMRREAGESRKLASYAGPVLRAEGATSLLLRRAPSMLYVIADGRRILGVLDSTFLEGKLAVQTTTPPATIENARVQGTDEIVFSDDFMRTADQQELGVWQKVRGDWRFHSVKETNKSADFKLSVNPFSLGGHSDDWAMVAAGHWFWDDYEFEASLKSEGGYAGIAFGCHGEGAYHLVRMDLHEPKLGPREIQLVRVRGEQREVLASAYVYGAAGQWFRPGVSVRGSAVKVLLDGAVLWQVVDPSIIGGPVGLYTEGPAETYFDDVEVRSNPEFAYDRSLAWWRNARKASGAWKLSTTPGQPKILNDNGPARVVSARRGEATYLVGDSRWETPILETTVTPGATGTVGLLYDYVDPANYRLARLTGPAGSPKSRVQFVQRVAGKDTVVTEAAGGYSPQRPTPLRLDLSAGDSAKLYVDGLLELVTAQPQPPAGRQGLYANDMPGAAFDRVSVCLTPEDDKETPVERESFVKDPYMQHWSSPIGEWFPVKGQANTFWHKGDFYGAYSLTFPLVADFRVAFGATELDFEEGYSLTTSTSEEKGKLDLTLSKGEHLKGKTSASLADGATFTLRRDGRYIWISSGEEPGLIYRDEQPLAGTRVGITSKSEIKTAAIQVTRHHVKDFLFEKAPAAWLEWGTWEITNRFSCTPTWSHMAGRSSYAALLWSKYALAGDYTIEYYAGMRMSTTKSMSYPRVGDMNVTFAADGLDFSTGYSYLVGAWDPGWTSKWTRLLRGQGTAAETDRPLVPRVRSSSGKRYIPVPYVASGRDVHGAWYYCKVRRIGKRIECYYDNELVLTYEDDDPLPGNRFAIWTYDNDMVVACVKVSYEKLWAPNRVVPAPGNGVHRPEAESLLLAAACAETPTLYSDFEHSNHGWSPATEEQTSDVAVASDTLREGNRCLRVKNLALGGDFGVAAPAVKDLDLAKVDELRFRYRVPKNAKINCYVQAQGRQHFVHLTGPTDSSVLMQSLGGIETTADNQWHEARFDLAAALRELYPTAESIPLQSLRFGNFHPGYLAVSIGGNPFGARYYLDDVRLCTVGPAARSVTWSVVAPKGKETPALQYAVAVDQSPTTAPETLLEGAEPAHAVEGLGDGLSFFHVRARTAEGRWTATAHLPLVAGAGKLECASTHPESKQPWGGAPVAFHLAPATGLNLDPKRSSLAVNGAAVALSSAAVTYDWRKRVLTFDPNRSTLAFEEGKPVTATLTAATALGEPATFTWEATYDRKLDETPPRPVRLAEPLVRDDFEDGIGAWGNLGNSGNALLVLDETTAASGKRSLRVVNPVLTGSWSARPTSRAFSLGKYPLLAFDYKVAEEINVDLAFTLGGRSRSVKFADADGALPRLGTGPEVTKDGQWHRAMMNLGEMARALPFAPNQFDVSQFSLVDSGYNGAAPGAYFNIDNFELIPAASGALGVPVKLVAHDPSGLAKLRYKWSDKPADLPTQELPADKLDQTLKVETEGLQYLHLAAQDAAGNWSEPSHYAFLIDNTPPALASTVPAQNGPLATRAIQVKFTDGGGAALDPKSIVFRVNDKDLSPTALNAAFSPKDNQLSWEWSAATDMFTGPVADGTSVKFALSPVKDFAGNADKPYEWTHTISYAADKEPPLPPEVTCSTHKSVCYDTFTGSLGKWQSYGSAPYGSIPTRVFDAAKGDYVCQLRLGSGSTYGAYVHSGAYNLAENPMLSFDYKIPKGLRLYFHAHINGAWYGIQVTYASRSYTNLGALPGITPDGNWHTATVNLYDLVKAKVSAKTHTLTYLILCNYGGAGNVLHFDNFHLFGPGATTATFTWKTVDPTGIPGYSYTLDNTAGTIPDEQPEGAPNTTTLRDLKPGLYYLHLRAQDGAGNWGPAVHYAYRVG